MFWELNPTTHHLPQGCFLDPPPPTEHAQKTRKRKHWEKEQMCLGFVLSFLLRQGSTISPNEIKLPNSWKNKHYIQHSLEMNNHSMKISHTDSIQNAFKISHKTTGNLVQTQSLLKPVARCAIGPFSQTVMSYKHHELVKFFMDSNHTCMSFQDGRKANWLPVPKNYKQIIHNTAKQGQIWQVLLGPSNLRTLFFPLSL